MGEEANRTEGDALDGLVVLLGVGYDDSHGVLVVTFRKRVVLISPELACDALFVVDFDLERLA